MFRESSPPSGTQDAPGEPGDSRRRLFELNEYRRAFGDFSWKAMNALLIAKDPLLQQIKIEERETVTATVTDLEGGGQYVQPPMAGEATLTFDWKPVVAGNYEQILSALDDAAQQRLDQLMPAFFESLNGMLDAAGQTVDAKGKPVSFEGVLEAYEKLDIEFDENDQPRLQTIVAGPAIVEKIKRVFAEVTPEQKKAFDELIERKRKEFHARRRTRRIP
jgi:hypothetical protein